MRAEVSEFERADGIEPRVFFAQNIDPVSADDAPKLARRLLQFAILRGDPAHLTRIFADSGAEVFRWNISQEGAARAVELRDDCPYCP